MLNFEAQLNKTIAVHKVAFSRALTKIIVILQIPLATPQRLWVFESHKCVGDVFVPSAKIYAQA